MLRPAVTPGHVVVIGAGPAGLKAAELAARRGHRVTIVEAADEPGGQLRHVRTTAARELYGAVDWLVGELAAAGATLRLGMRLDGEALRRLAPDVVVLATGAHRQSLPVLAGAVPGQVVAAIDVLAGAEVGADVLVFDRAGDMEASLVAEMLLAQGRSVTYATPLDGFAPRAGYLQHLDLLPLFEAKQCEILVRREIVGVEGGIVHLVDRAGGIVARRADTIVAALLPEPDNDLLPAAHALGVPVHVIGDALAPRHARAAIADGDRIGRTV